MSICCPNCGSEDVYTDVAEDYAMCNECGYSEDLSPLSRWADWIEGKNKMQKMSEKGKVSYDVMPSGFNVLKTKRKRDEKKRKNCSTCFYGKIDKLVKYHRCHYCIRNEIHEDLWVPKEEE